MPDRNRPTFSSRALLHLMLANRGVYQDSMYVLEWTYTRAPEERSRWNGIPNDRQAELLAIAKRGRTPREQS